LLLGSLFLNISQATILEGLDTSKFVKILVASFSTITYLTTMVHLKRDKKDKMIDMWYVWANPAMHPVGQELLAQYLGCHQYASLRRQKVGIWTYTGSSAKASMLMNLNMLSSRLSRWKTWSPWRICTGWVAPGQCLTTSPSSKRKRKMIIIIIMRGKLTGSRDYISTNQWSMYI
jgi:hypothetical protein